MTSIENRVRANLLQARKAGKLKQSDVASMLGVSVQSVWSWENGRQFPAPDKLEKLAELLGLGDGTWFIEDHGNEMPKQDSTDVVVPSDIWRVCIPLYKAYSQINPSAPKLPSSLTVLCSLRSQQLTGSPAPGLDMVALAQFAQLALSA